MNTRNKTGTILRKTILVALILGVTSVDAATVVGAGEITDVGKSVAAFIIVLVFGGLGGILFQAVQGITICGKKIEPLCTSITVPPLVGMIIFGCIARNAFGDITENHYPEIWADWGRQICLSIILMRGGLELDFEGKGLTVVLLTLVPQVAEAVTVACFCRLFFGMPWAMCFAQGFTIGAVSPAVLVPSVMYLIELKRGVAKGIPHILLAASSFDDISAITFFSVFSTIAINNVKSEGFAELEAAKIAKEGNSTSTAEKVAEVAADASKAGAGTDVKTMIGMAVFYVVTGFFVGFLVGMCMKCFKTFDEWEWEEQTVKWIKMVVMLTVAISVPIITFFIEFGESKYILIIFFGYFTYQVWGEDGRPQKELAAFWLWI